MFPLRKVLTIQNTPTPQPLHWLYDRAVVLLSTALLPKDTQEQT